MNRFVKNSSTSGDDEFKTGYFREIDVHSGLLSPFHDFEKPSFDASHGNLKRPVYVTSKIYAPFPCASVRSPTPLHLSYRSVGQVVGVMVTRRRVPNRRYIQEEDLPTNQTIRCLFSRGTTFGNLRASGISRSARIRPMNRIEWEIGGWRRARSGKE